MEDNNKIISYNNFVFMLKDICNEVKMSEELNEEDKNKLIYAIKNVVCYCTNRIWHIEEMKKRSSIKLKNEETFGVKEYVNNIIYAIATLEPIELADILKCSQDERMYRNAFFRSLTDEQKECAGKRIQEEYAKFKNIYKARTENDYYHYYVRFCLEYKTCAYILFQIVNESAENSLEDIYVLLEDMLKQYKELFTQLVIIKENEINKLPAELLSWILLKQMEEKGLITEHKLELLINRKTDTFKWNKNNYEKGEKNENYKYKNKKE